MVRLHVSVQALFRRGLGILLRLGSMCALEWDACPFFVFRPSFVDYWRTWKYEISLLRGLVNDSRWIFHILESCSHGKFCILHLFDMQANIITTQSFYFRTLCVLIWSSRALFFGQPEPPVLLFAIFCLFCFHYSIPASQMKEEVTFRYHQSRAHAYLQWLGCDRW